MNLLKSLIMILIFSSCSSDDNNKAVPIFNDLIIGQWNYSTQFLNGNNQEFTDECQKDFEYSIYSLNGIYNQTEFENLTGNGCEQVQSSIGTWNIENTIINETVNGDDYVGTILVLNETTLSIQYGIVVLFNQKIFTSISNSIENNSFTFS